MTITSYPGERATLKGRLRITDSANFVTVESLDLDGRDAANLPSPSVYGDDVVFRDNDVTDYHTGDLLPARVETSTAARSGPRSSATASTTAGVLPAQNHHHGIYIEASDDARILTTGSTTTPTGACRCSPTRRARYIARNVIDGNGQGVSFARESANNVVEHNVISNSVLRWNIEDWELSGRATSRAATACGRLARTLYNRAGRDHGEPATSRRVEQPDRRPAVRGPGGEGLPPRVQGSPCAALLAGGGTRLPPARSRGPGPAARPGAAARPAPEPQPGRRLAAEGEGQVAAPGRPLQPEAEDPGRGRRRPADRAGRPVRRQAPGGPRHPRSVPGDVDGVRGGSPTGRTRSRPGPTTARGQSGGRTPSASRACEAAAAAAKGKRGKSARARLSTAAPCSRLKGRVAPGPPMDAHSRLCQGASDR